MIASSGGICWRRKISTGPPPMPASTTRYLRVEPKSSRGAPLPLRGPQWGKLPSQPKPSSTWAVFRPEAPPPAGLPVTPATEPKHHGAAPGSVLPTKSLHSDRTPCRPSQGGSTWPVQLQPPINAEPKTPNTDLPMGFQDKPAAILAIRQRAL